MTTTSTNAASSPHLPEPRTPLVHRHARFPVVRLPALIGIAGPLPLVFSPTTGLAHVGVLRAPTAVAVLRVLAVLRAGAVRPPSTTAQP